MGLEVLALGSTLVSAGMGAAGAAMTGAANSASARYRAQVARYNAELAQNNAAQAIQVSQHQAMRVGFEGAERLGQIRSMYGAGNLDVNSGSPQQVQTSQQIVNRLDQSTETWKGDVRATDFRNQSQNFLAEAAIKEAEAQNAKTAGMFGVANSLIGGAGQFAGKWANFQLNGVL